MSEVFDLDNWVVDLNAMRRAGPAVVEAELVKLEYQVKTRRERLGSRLQESQMWIDDGQLCVEDEQLRLEGAETCLLNALARLKDQSLVDDVETHLINELARLERDQLLADETETHLKDAQSQLEEVQGCFDQTRPY